MGLFSFRRTSATPRRATSVPAHHGVNEICSPATGSLIPLSDVPDPVFAGGTLGQGFGVKPTEDVAYAPVSGKLIAACETGHAYGIRSDSGIEVLVHIGVDTVEMKGDGFDPLAKQGDYVDAGQPLVRFSSSKIKAAGHSDVIATIVIDGSPEKKVRLASIKSVKAGEVAMEILA